MSVQIARMAVSQEASPPNRSTTRMILISNSNIAAPSGGLVCTSAAGRQGAAAISRRPTMSPSAADPDG
jgi:hypothetical protein